MVEEGHDDVPLTGSDKNTETAIAERDSVRDQATKNDSNEGKKLDETENTSGNLPHIYRQDVVRCKNTGKIGMVMEVAGDTDSESDMSDEDEDEDDQEEFEAEDAFDVNKSEYGDGENDDIVEESPDEKESNGDDDDGPLLANQVRVLWLNDSENVHNINDVEVIDRGFLHGDYVASTLNPTGQLGVVVDVNITVDLLSFERSIISNISSKSLKRVRDFAEGDYVVLGPWLGRVDDVLDNVTVSFDDGAVCEVLKADPDTLIPVYNSNMDGHYPYYPGQRVRSTSSSVFKSSRWLCGSWKSNRKEGTVTNVSVGSALIFWIASAGYGPDCSTAPADEQSPKYLKLVSCFSHANWQLGDWCILPTAGPQLFSALDSKIALDEFDQNGSESLQERDGSLGNSVSEASHIHHASMDIDSSAPMETGDLNSQFNGSSDSSACSSVSELKDSVPDPRPSHRKKIRKAAVRRGRKTRKMDQDFERALLIANTMTRVDVAWQDGTIEHGLVSTSLIPIDNPGDHEFVSEQYVLEKAPDETDDARDIRRVGVVKSVNAKERTACVRWLKPVFRAEDPREFGEEEVASVYELEDHPDYDYCYGDVVVRLTQVPVPVNKNLESVDPDKHQCINDNDQEEEHSECKETDEEGDKEVYKDFSDLSWVGNITNLTNGDIEVTWADGMVSMVGPQSIYVVGRDEDDDSVGGSEEDETESATVIITDGEERATEWDDNSGINGALSFPLAALGYVTRLATGIFTRGWNSSVPSMKESTGDNESDSQGLMETSDKTVSSNNNASPECDEPDKETIISGTADPSSKLKPLSNTRPQETCHGDAACGFKRFDTSVNPLDHYFLGNGHGQINHGRKWLKKVQQDWNILQNNLPEGIYVRVYEDRMDLLRAVIVGAYGTPYQDGLFFFDFFLPPEYPCVPPSVYYHSGGWRINPNLYEEGKVCLSLLNTWTGKGNEVWDPASSSILQVLVSLQGLVLNSKPYFNEAGYDKQLGTAEGEKNSLSYNENTYLLNVKTMMLHMRKPPKDFEELVKEHFKRRGYYILKACDSYCNGQLIGSLKKDASPSDDSSPDSTSVGFKLMLSKILPKLFGALKGVGAEVGGSGHPLQV
uniref:E2 ubiquitin-conjugating enzyme n=1 Tax=Kalanchoe fedtschenkoi TaxID=63787 RepID=A0A7N0UQ17_KALFE